MVTWAPKSHPAHPSSCTSPHSPPRSPCCFAPTFYAVPSLWAPAFGPLDLIGLSSRYQMTLSWGLCIFNPPEAPATETRGVGPSVLPIPTHSPRPGPSIFQSWFSLVSSRGRTPDRYSPVPRGPAVGGGRATGGRDLGRSLIQGPRGWLHLTMAFSLPAQDPSSSRPICGPSPHTTLLFWFLFCHCVFSPAGPHRGPGL